MYAVTAHELFYPPLDSYIRFAYTYTAVLPEVLNGYLEDPLLFQKFQQSIWTVMSRKFTAQLLFVSNTEVYSFNKRRIYALSELDTAYPQWRSQLFATTHFRYKEPHYRAAMEFGLRLAVTVLVERQDKGYPDAYPRCIGGWDKEYLARAEEWLSYHPAVIWIYQRHDKFLRGCLNSFLQQEKHAMFVNHFFELLFTQNMRFKDPTPTLWACRGEIADYPQITRQNLGRLRDVARQHRWQEIVTKCTLRLEDTTS